MPSWVSEFISCPIENSIGEKKTKQKDIKENILKVHRPKAQGRQERNSCYALSNQEILTKFSKDGKLRE